MKNTKLLFVCAFALLGMFSCKEDVPTVGDLPESDFVGTYAGEHTLATIPLSEDTLDITTGASSTDGMINIYSRAFNYTFEGVIEGNKANIATLAITDYAIAGGEDTVKTASGSGFGTLDGNIVKTTLNVKATTTLPAPLNNINGKIQGTFTKQ